MSIYIFPSIRFIFKIMIGQIIVNRGSSVILRRTLLTAQSRCMLQIPRLYSSTSQSQVSNWRQNCSIFFSSGSQERCQDSEQRKKARYEQQVRLTTWWLSCFSFGDWLFGVCQCGESSASQIRLLGFLRLSEIRRIMSTKTKSKVWNRSMTIHSLSNFMERKCPQKAPETPKF